MEHINQNRQWLDKLIERFQYWLHVEDKETLYTIAAVKISHKIRGDPVWIMVIGPSSDGKSEILRSFTNEDTELTVDDLTTNTFVTGYISHATDGIPSFAEELKNHVWYIYDMSILLSKKAETRSEILSQLRMIYDGKLEKRYGNKVHISADTTNNTLICGSTPAIDSTMLEDQILGTRFIHWRMNTKDNLAVMDKITEMEDKITVMRASLKAGVGDFVREIVIEIPELTETEMYNLKILTEQTRKLRTSVELDKAKEVRNIAYPEGAGRLFKQLVKLYKSYKLIGLTEEEATKCIRKVCLDNINPVRIKILQYLVDNNNEFETTSSIAQGCRMGKGHTKGILNSLFALDIISYEPRWNELYHRDEDHWLLTGGDFKLLLNIKPEINQSVLK